jgi:aminoglycoside 3-N-acetyltransferase
MAEVDTSWAKRFKQRMKPLYFGGQRAVARALFAYSPDGLESAVRALGVGAGDALLVHSGYRRTSGFSGTPADVTECLLKILGAEGHLLMMSIPYRGSSQRYAEGNPLFDVKRTPSSVGMISEVFRRRDDVARSLSPLHPIVAHGPLAKWLTLDHEKTVYSCGKGSPFERFLQLGGKFLFFDAPYTSLTFMHYVEDQFRERLPVPLYDREPVLLRVRDAGGEEFTVRQYVFSQEARARRNFATIEADLRRRGALRSGRIGNSRLLSVVARDVLESAARLVEQGPGFYK